MSVDLFPVLDAVDPRALDDADLKLLLCDLGRARARIDALEAAAIAELDARGCYVTDGAVNAKAWLAHNTAVSRVVAGARVLLAKRLRRMPAMAEALAAGQVTSEHARALARGLTPRTLEAFARDEALLTEEATELEADMFDRLVTQWLAVNDQDGPEPATGPPSELHASSSLGGRVRIDGDLDVEDGAEFLAELDVIYDRLWQEDQAADDSDPLKRRSHAERDAAALTEMARRSSSTHDEDATAETEDSVTDETAKRVRGAGRPRRRQIIAVIDIDPLTGEMGPTGRLDDGSLLPREVLERWMCDCAVARVVMRGKSFPIDLGQLTYTPSAAQRRALLARDGGCIIDGCDRQARWCDAHHVEHFPHGPTSLDNLVLLCSRHHKHVHRGIIKLVRVEGRWQAFRSDDTPLRQRPPPSLAA